MIHTLRSRYGRVSTGMMAAAISLFFTFGCASTSTSPTSENPTSASETKANEAKDTIKITIDDTRLLDLKTIEELIRQKAFDKVLKEHLNPLISKFEGIVRSESKQIFAPSSLIESIVVTAEAASENRAVIALNGDYAEAYYLRGYCSVERGDYSSARDDLERAVELSPKNPRFLSELGQWYQSKKDWNKALSYYTKAEEAAKLVASEEKTQASRRRALRGQGYCLTELERFDESEKVYKECLAIDVTDKTAKEELIYIEDLRRRNSLKKGKY